MEVTCMLLINVGFKVWIWVFLTKLPLGKNRTFLTKKSTKKCTGWYDSAAYDDIEETKSFKADIEDEGKDGSHTSACSLWYNQNKKEALACFHLQLLERWHKIARSTFHHVNIASEERIGEATKQPVEGGNLFVWWLLCECKDLCNVHINHNLLQAKPNALPRNFHSPPGSQEACHWVWIGSDHNPCKNCGQSRNLERLIYYKGPDFNPFINSSVTSRNLKKPACPKHLLEEAAQRGKDQRGYVLKCCWNMQ